MLLTQNRLPDGNHDNIIALGRNNLLDVGSGDTIRFSNGVTALRYLGQSDGLSVYADASARPKGAIEGSLATATLQGDASGVKAETFFYDTALGAALGNDRIEHFGASDILVTTTKITDSNHDNIIQFGRNGLLNLGLESISMTVIRGQVVTSLEYDGAVTHNGTSYYVYSLVGSPAGTADLHFS